MNQHQAPIETKMPSPNFYEAGLFSKKFPPKNPFAQSGLCHSNSSYLTSVTSWTEIRWRVLFESASFHPERQKSKLEIMSVVSYVYTNNEQLYVKTKFCTVGCCFNKHKMSHCKLETFHCVNHI